MSKDINKFSDFIEYSKKFRNFYGITEKIGCHFVSQKKYFLVGRTKVLTLLSLQEDIIKRSVRKMNLLM